MTRKRNLRPDELELWHKVARTAEKMHPQPLSPKPPAPLSEPKTRESPTSIQRFAIGQNAKRSASAAIVPAPIGDQLAASSVQMDNKAFGKLKRGKLVPEARLDLHGMVVADAHPALIGFITRSQLRGMRLVLVITGKGRTPDPYDPSPIRRGVLKQQVPQWLRMAPIGQMVLQVSEAHIKHGGSGAYYVYLRRRRQLRVPV